MAEEICSMGSISSKKDGNDTEIDAEDLKQVKDTVRSLIHTHGGSAHAPVLDEEDIKLLTKYPRTALKKFQDLLKIQLKVDKTEFNDGAGSKSAPDLIPKQPFNNINMFDRMPHGYTRVEPKHLNDLINILQKAGNENKQVKAIGACYSFSNVGFSNGYVIEMNKYLHNILEIDQSLLRDSSKEHLDTLCKMEAGTLIEAILEHLWPTSKRGETEGYRTMMSTTGYSGLSIAGTTGCGAHGSGIDKPPLQDSIESIHLVTLDEKGKVVQYWIEPSSGITDPEKFKASKYGTTVTLIQDDDYFNATTVHVGTLGVVYSYIIRVQPAFYLQEYRYMQSWDATKIQLSTLIKNNKKKRGEEDALHSFEIWISPYPLRELSLSVVSTYKWAKPPTVRKRPLSFFASNLENELLRVLTVYVSKHLQSLMPLVMYLALAATTEEEPVTMPSTEALSIGTPNGIKVIVSENAIDASNLEEVINAVDDMIMVYQQALQEDSRYFTTSPFSMRFTAPSKAFLAPQYNRPSCMVETPVLLDTLGQHLNLQRIRLMTQDKFKSRPHWGQINGMDSQQLKTLYPESYEKFLDVYKKFNVSGAFANYFTKNLV